MVRLSKYDLTEYATVKIPKSMFLQLKEENDFWSELVRDIIFEHLKQGVSEQ